MHTSIQYPGTLLLQWDPYLQKYLRIKTNNNYKHDKDHLQAALIN